MDIEHDTRAKVCHDWRPAPPLAGQEGTEGRGFLPDLRQVSRSALGSALLGGIVFNLSNILLVAAIDIAGMAVAFPIGVGLALVVGVVTNYRAQPRRRPSAPVPGRCGRGGRHRALGAGLPPALLGGPEDHRQGHRPLGGGWPAQSGYARLIKDVLDWSATYPDDWKKTWQLIEEKWDTEDSCPDGALLPFNIDARINGAYIALGLLYGRLDFGRTLELATRSGQDSDCNPSTAGGILGVMLGYAGIPGGWKSGIPALADKKFDYTRSSLNDICRSTLARALKLVEMAGGAITDTDVIIPEQAPKAAPLEQWDMGVPVKRVAVTDPAWSFKRFSGAGGARSWDTAKRMRASGAGAEATLTFTGAALAVVGDMTQHGGRADVYLDRKPAQAIDAYTVERTNDNDLWHVYGLPQGQHTLRVVTRDDADARSKGKTISIVEAVVYRARTRHSRSPGRRR